MRNIWHLARKKSSFRWAARFLFVVGFVAFFSPFIASEQPLLVYPEMEYFTELYRVSKEQIIWGANYFTQYLPASMGWIFWDKGQDLSMSDGELAYTSFQKALRRFKINRGQLMVEGGTIHPTQKPVRLYNKCFEYAKLEAGAKVLDTHLGSGSSRISADKNGFGFTGFEIDKEYYELSEKRFKQYKSQLRIEAYRIVANEQGFSMLGDLKIVKPGTAVD